MHEDEVRATPELVERLLVEQCPQWADLPVTSLPDDVEGTDNVLFRLGDELVVRMPKVEWAQGQAESDAAGSPGSPRTCPWPCRCRSTSVDPRRATVGLVGGPLGRRIHPSPTRVRRRAARAETSRRSP